MSASPATKYTEETVLWVKRHTPKLMSFAISRPEEYRFAAGQFSRLGFPEGSGFIWRAYSVVSAEYDATLESFAVLIEDGPMSARFEQLEAGSTILLDKTATGFLLPERFPDGSDLIMLSTGSGIAPRLGRYVSFGTDGYGAICSSPCQLGPAPGHQRLLVCGQCRMQPACETLPAGLMACSHRRQHRNAGLDEIGKLHDKATALGLHAAEAVDHHQIDTIGQCLTQHSTGLAQRLRVQVAGHRRAPQIL